MSTRSRFLKQLRRDHARWMREGWIVDANNTRMGDHPFFYQIGYYRREGEHVMCHGIIDSVPWRRGKRLRMKDFAARQSVRK